MPAVPQYKAVASKASIATLFAMAEIDGEARILVESEHACILLRRKCYAHRSQLRKSNISLTGLGISPYDSYTFPWRYLDHLGKWEFTITSNELIEFELLIPDDTAFDISRFEFITDSDIPQFNLDHHEAQFERAADEWQDSLDHPMDLTRS